MSSKSEKALERRRVQNRIAQRKFRLKHNQQKANEADPQQGTEPFSDLAQSSSYTNESQIHGYPDIATSAAESSTLTSSNADVDCGSTFLDSEGPVDMENIFTADRDSAYGTLSPTSSASYRGLEQSLNGIADISFLNLSDTASGSNPITIPGMMANSPILLKQGGWRSAIHIAAQNGHTGIARALLEHEADCNERDSEGLTPLMHAIIGGYEEVANLLLLHGARTGDVDSENRSALHWAVLCRREPLLDVLLNSRAGGRISIDRYDNAGRTPLHLAVETGFEAGVQKLLHFNANPHCKARY